MQLPFKYDDLLNDDFGLETNSTTVREVNKIQEKDNTNISLDSISSTMVEWTASDYLSDDVWESLVAESVSGMFSKTFFDDIALELDLDNTYDSLFAQTVPGHWSGPPIKKDVFIKSHDCMWAGHCGSSEHKDDCDKALQMLWAGFINPPIVPVPIPVQPAQQSLLKPILRNAGVPVINMITPQTPPMSDDEKEQNKSKVARLSSAASDIDEADQDLREYFGSKLDTLDNPQDEEESSESSSESSEEEEDERPNRAGPSRVTSNVTSIRCNLQATENDHSYHKGKNSSMIMSDLGIDTPSDSGGSTPPRCESVKSYREEEIDVVSVSDRKYPVGARIGYIPPTNPPNGARRNVQRTAESPITNGRNNRNGNGVKVMLPTKRSPAASNYPPAKRRAANPANENKGRRPRQTRATNLSSGRRRSNNGHDSEGSEYEQHPPMEKRNLHNDMERQRRVDLRKAFEDLRKLVPEVMRKERAAKVVILREAAKYCNNLTHTSKSMQEHKVDLENYQEKLLWKLSHLRRRAAMEKGVVFNQENYEDDYEEE